MSLPPELATGADYGMTVLAAGNPAAAKFALIMLAQQGQEILARNGFEALLLVTPEQFNSRP